MSNCFKQTGLVFKTASKGRQTEIANLQKAEADSLMLRKQFAQDFENFIALSGVSRAGISAGTTGAKLDLKLAQEEVKVAESNLLSALDHIGKAQDEIKKLKTAHPNLDIGKITEELEQARFELGSLGCIFDDPSYLRDAETDLKKAQDAEIELEKTFKNALQNVEEFAGSESNSSIFSNPGHAIKRRRLSTSDSLSSAKMYDSPSECQGCECRSTCICDEFNTAEVGSGLTESGFGAEDKTPKNEDFYLSPICK